MVIVAGIADRMEDVLQAGPCAAVGHNRCRRVRGFEREINCYQTAADQENDLNDIRPDDGFQTSVYRVES